MEVKLHDIGEGMHEAEILHYYVKPGQNVKNDEPLVEIQTDKMTAELTAPSDGVIEEIKFAIGDVVEVGTTILFLRPANENDKQTMVLNEDKRQQPNAARDDRPQTGTNPHKADHPKKRVQAPPHTRRIARENGVDIEQVTGTGPSGRITDDDVYAFMKAKAQSVSESVGEAQPKLEAEKPAQPNEYIPFRGRRKQIAKKMTQSLFTAPHVTHFDEVMMSDLLHMKQALKEDGESISVAAFFIKAIQWALQEHRIFNSRLNEEEGRIELATEVNIGLATATEDGLIVPVLKRVDQKTISEIHTEMKELTTKAKENRLAHSDISGGTFTISNVGPLGSTGATPILNYPETGLMAFHKTKRAPVVIDEEIVIRDMMNLSFTFDHRVADGAQAAAFANSFIRYIQQPHHMMLKLV
ncbi:dihydrolipoamide acetyltransferase family protein [Thalassobacillus sp. CUG 92003]|uniref:dihydrolipoamide acetyltransferase family protein n=1 Tax=Thalassobacillus sp. CUG 92003 TaxID=2736641 RepID=UPI0015E65978|nr:dihydrolipoamide acetyltransferase family protein [Thalassobacillus sp. CUG 92003]